MNESFCNETRVTSKAVCVDLAAGGNMFLYTEINHRRLAVLNHHHSTINISDIIYHL